jgi:hypothetical protein
VFWTATRTIALAAAVTVVQEKRLRTRTCPAGITNAPRPMPVRLRALLSASDPAALVGQIELDLNINTALGFVGSRSAANAELATAAGVG